jgi:endonuclease I
MIFKVFVIYINWFYYMKYFPSSKHILKNNILLPTLYNNKYKQISIEHIYPRCYLKKDHHNDFHNTFIACKSINNIRSNYMYSDIKNITWKHIGYNNYISHEYKLFNPRDDDKGIIARAILYMIYKYNYKILMDKVILYNWCLNNEPSIKEEFHNLNGYKLQGNNNPFISKYYDKDYINFLRYILQI